jgi:UDP-N-acetyl-2-amino-2-deoxyglucuronate dehydrogenase
MKRFALIGAAGYIAPRHITAIKETGNQLVAAVDPHDSVGILDRYFFDVAYFKEFERFDRHIDKLMQTDERVDYVSICSPNYLHDSHIRFALRVNAHAICEKPLVINPWNVDALMEKEAQANTKVYCILQLRLHPAIIALKEKFNNQNKKHKVNLTYFTSRGPWYLHSWKGNESQSGGLVTNIGIHFFDMLIWIFGDVKGVEVTKMTSTEVSGTLELEKADVTWSLSVDRSLVPKEALDKGMSTYRSITVDGEEVEFSGGFTDLHTLSYQEILAGRGFGLEDARRSIDLVHRIRDAV